MRLMLSLSLLLLLAPSAGAATPAEARAWLEARDTRAAPAIEALAKAQPDNAEVQVLLVRLRLQQGRAEDAVDLAEDVADMAPDNASAHYWLGNAYGSRIGQVGMLSQAMMAPKVRGAFERAVEEVTQAAHRLLSSLSTTAAPRNREEEARKGRERSLKRFGQASA